MRPDNPELVTHASASVSLGMFAALTDIPGVCNGWAKLDLVDVLLTLARDKDMHPTLMHIVHELACNVEDALLNSVHWETSCKKFLPAISEARGAKKMPLDPDVVHELRGMVAGSLVRTAKGLEQGSGCTWLELACRRSLPGCNPGEETRSELQESFLQQLLFCNCSGLQEVWWQALASRHFR